MTDIFTILNQQYWSGGRWLQRNTLKSNEGGIRLYYEGLKKDFPILVESLELKIYQYDGGAVNIKFYITDETVTSIGDNFSGPTITIKSPGQGNTASFNLSPLLEFSEVKEIINSGENFYIHMKASSVASFYRYTHKSNSLTGDWIYGYSSGTVSSSKLDLEAQQFLTITPIDPNYFHKVIWQIKNIEGSYVQHSEEIISVGNKTATTIYDSNYLSTIYFDVLSKETEGKVIIETYDSFDKFLGNFEIIFEIVIPESLGAPKEISLVLSPKIFEDDPNGVFSESGLYVVNRTKILWKGNAILQGGATLNSCQLTYSGGLVGVETSSLDTDTEGKIITGSPSIVCTLKIIDSRGFSASVTKTITPTIYNKPTVYFSYAKRMNSDWTSEEPVDGRSALLKISFSYTSLNDKNYIEYFNYIGQDADNLEITYTPDFSDLSQAKFSNLSEKEIKFTISIKDGATGELVSNSISIPAAFYILHVPKGGQGFAIGSVAENNFIKLGWPVKGLEIPLDSNFKIFGSDANTQYSFQEAIGGPFLPLSGGTMTGPLKIGSNNYIEGSNGNEILSYNYSNMTGAPKGTGIGVKDEITTIRGSELKYFKYINSTSSATYDILHSGNYTNYDFEINNNNSIGLGGNFQSYNAALPDNADKDYYPNGVYFRKYGKIVEVYGAISPAEKITGSMDLIQICSIPSGYAPKYLITRICQGSGYNKWLLRIHPHNDTRGITFSRYGAYQATDVEEGNWLTFHEIWLVD